MSSSHHNQRDHILRAPIEEAIKQGLDGGLNLKKITEAILEELDEHNLIAYLPRYAVNLLTPQGRVLMFLMQRPGLSIRELSVCIGVSETCVNKALSVLVKDKLLTRTKVKNRYGYRINLNKVRYHPDVRRLFHAIHDGAETEEEISS